MTSPTVMRVLVAIEAAYGLDFAGEDVERARFGTLGDLHQIAVAR